MYPQRRPRRLYPKISTMPRQRSEAAYYLDVYRLTVEKRHLKLELAHLEKRRDHIQTRLSALEQQMTQLEQAAQQTRETAGVPEPDSIIYPPATHRATQDSFPVHTVTLEY